MDVKQDIINLLPKHTELLTLGDFATLETYLKEEMRELDLSNSWHILKEKERMENNIHNTLLWYLIGLAPMPKELEHHWTGGDFPDCLRCDTSIRTDKGNVEIGLLRVGTKVYNSNDELVEVIYTQDRLSSFYETLYEIEWDDGTKTVCSGNHRLLIDGKYISIGDLPDKL